MQSGTRKLFILLSLLILISDVAFVLINRQADIDSLEESLQQKAITVQKSLNLTMSLVYENMSQLASFIGNDQEVQQLFLAGKNAVAQEGGGPGSEQAALARQTLYKKVSPSWNELMRQFDARQLHFHLGPGSLSYLRVHKPDKFGDRMDDVRHIIVDTYADQLPKQGFETGRIYSGLRATVPIRAFDAKTQQEVLVGVLEVGTSFRTVLDKLLARAQVESIVLLKESHVRDIMWFDFIERKLKRISPESPCFLEAASSQLAADIVRTCNGIPKTEKDPVVMRRSHGDRDYAVTRIPLFDYRADSGAVGFQGNVGAILVIDDISHLIAMQQAHLRNNLSIAIVGFLIIETLLYFCMRLAVRRLEALVARKTRELKELKDYFEDQSQHDGLTGLFNHRAFIDLLQTELKRSERRHSPLSVMMLDLDHFKHINDDYGHSVGDQVLEAVSGVIHQISRETDIAGRYGGEEFCIALLDTSIDGALGVAERLLVAVRDIRIYVDGRAIEVTTSIGIAQWQDEESSSDLINRADHALYQAKHGGRDRVVTG